MATKELPYSLAVAKARAEVLNLPNGDFKQRLEQSLYNVLKIIRNREKSAQNGLNQFMKDFVLKSLFNPANAFEAKFHEFVVFATVLRLLVDVPLKRHEMRQFIGIMFRDEVEGNSYQFFVNFLVFLISSNGSNLHKEQVNGALEAMHHLLDSTNRRTEIMLPFLSTFVSSFIDQSPEIASRLNDLDVMNLNMAQYFLQATVALCKLDISSSGGNENFIQLRRGQIDYINRWLDNSPMLCLECADALSHLITWSIGAQLDLLSTQVETREQFVIAFNRLHMSMLGALFVAPLPNFTIGIEALKLAFDLIVVSTCSLSDKAAITDRLMQTVITLRYAKILKLKKIDLVLYSKPLPATELLQATLQQL